MRKKLFCALMSLSIVLSSGIAYAAEPEVPENPAKTVENAVDPQTAVSSEESAVEPLRAEGLDEVYEYDEETGGMILVDQNVANDEWLGAGEDLPKIDAPTNARWEKTTGNLLFNASESGTGKYCYSIYREGQAAPVYSSSITYGAAYDTIEREMGLSEYALETMSTGRYYFAIYAEGNDSYADSDICTSDILDYVRPDRRLQAPFDLKWNNSVATWSLAERSAIAYKLQCKEEGSDEWKYVASGFYHRGGVTQILRRDFTEDFNKKGMYRFCIMALSNNIFEAVDSEWSDWSPEISSEEIGGSVAEEIRELLDKNAGADAILDALEEKDTEGLAVSMQTDQDTRDAMTEAEKRFSEEKGISVNTSVASDMADKVSGGVSILGAAFNAGSDVRNMTLNITKPTQEKEVDKEQYKNVVQINMTLDGAADTQNLKVPVRITMPIPVGVDPENLQILHYHNDGSYETIWPYISDGMASFTLTSFSTFAFVNKVDASDLPEDCPFSDVKIIPGNWKYESIRYVYLNGIMNGISGTTRFDPDEPLTRGMFATVLYRMAGNPKVEFKDQFEDVKAGIYYSDAVIWAFEEGIVQGLDGGTRYGVDEHITREQIAKMLYKYGKDVQKYAMEDSADIDSFPDRSSVSGWAVDYMKWAVGSGMITGRNDGGTYYLEPRGEATRAECAAMLMRFSERYK